MSEKTNIEWASHTGGPYLGCEPVSPGCANCYAWLLALTRLEPIFRAAYRKAGFADWETRPVWGRTATRVLTKGFWKDARRINAQHAKAGTRGRWFPSMIDWLDEMPGGIIDQDGKRLNADAVLADFLALVHECGHLDWLLLTKRPENFAERLRGAADAIAANKLGRKEDWKWIRYWCVGAFAPSNVWLGVSVEDQARADERIPLLLSIPAVVRFLSCEPLLGPVSLQTIAAGNGTYYDLSYPPGPGLFDSQGSRIRDARIDWVIVGGESGQKARPMHPSWAKRLRNQCADVDVPFFFKQWGEWREIVESEGEFNGPEELPDDWRKHPDRYCCLRTDGRRTSGYDGSACAFLLKAGKKAAGRMLDGREWNEFPDSERLATT